MSLGTLSVHSGQIPKAKVLVESRMGNKVINITVEFRLDLMLLLYEGCDNFARIGSVRFRFSCVNEGLPEKVSSL